MNLDQFNQELTQIETRVDRLRALYEQYFQGLERMEPSVLRREVDRRVELLRRHIPRNTAARFRFNQLTQKYNTYTIYWQRTLRQIEEGTFRRDILKKRKRLKD